MAKSGPISRDQHGALWALINKTRLAQGWNSLDLRSAEPMIQAWADEFNRYRIPIEHYPELYDRAFKVRRDALSIGKEPPSFDAVLIASQWSGEHGLSAELRDRDVKAGKFLPSVSASNCARCRGTGIEIIYKQNGEKLGARNGCQHEPLRETEWLFHEERRLENLGAEMINQARVGKENLFSIAQSKVTATESDRADNDTPF